MKLLILILSLAISSPAFSATTTLPIAPKCAKGTLRFKDGEVQKVYLSFKYINENRAYLERFIIGDTDWATSAEVISNNEVQFNDNNDYTPGGHATYNTDIYLKFYGRSANGYYKHYKMKNGKGGFGKSKPQSLKEEGRFSLQTCTARPLATY